MGNQPTYSLPIRKVFFFSLLVKDSLSHYSLFPIIILIVREEIVSLKFPILILNVILIPIRDEFIRLNLRIEMVEVVEIVAHGGIVPLLVVFVKPFWSEDPTDEECNNDSYWNTNNCDPFDVLWIITVDEWSVSSCHDGIVPKWFGGVNGFTAIPQAFPIFDGWTQGDCRCHFD
jgi:hypothetical protein